MGAGLFGGDVSEGIQRIVVQNGGVLLLVALLLQYAPRAIEAQLQQAKALAELAAAVREQGGSHERALSELTHGQNVMLDRLTIIRDHVGAPHHER
jgi:hypothetical protein